MEIQPELKIYIYSRKVFDTTEKAEQLLDYLMSSELFAPTHYSEDTPPGLIQEENRPDIIEMITRSSIQKKRPKGINSNTLLKRENYPEGTYRIRWSTLPHHIFRMSAYYINKDVATNPQSLKQWVDFVMGLIKLHEAWYAIIGLNEEQREKNFLTWRVQYPKVVASSRSGVGLKLEEGFPGIYWGSYFQAWYVDWFGREKFETIPCYEKQWFDDGSVFFTIAPSPFDWNTPEARQNETAIKEQLGKRAFFDMETVRRVMAEAPVEHATRPESVQSPRWIPNYPFPAESHWKLERKKVKIVQKNSYDDCT